MAKKTLKTAAQAVTKPAVRRNRPTKTASTPVTASPIRRASGSRTSSSRTKKPAALAVADDRGMSAVVAAEVLAVAPEPTYDEVATRAYDVYLRRHGAPGNPDHDWMVALDELRRERGII